MTEFTQLSIQLDSVSWSAVNVAYARWPHTRTSAAPVSRPHTGTNYKPLFRRNNVVEQHQLDDDNSEGNATTERAREKERERAGPGTGTTMKLLANKRAKLSAFN